MDWGSAAPYFAATVALLVGGTSALIASLNARAALREQRQAFDQQRQTEREVRLREKRSEVYVAVLEWTQAAFENANRLSDLSVDEREQSLVEYPVELARDLSAKVTAFGSDEVLGRVKQMGRIAACVARKDFKSFFLLFPEKEQELEKKVDDVEPQILLLITELTMVAELRAAELSVQRQIRAELDPDHAGSGAEGRDESETETAYILSSSGLNDALAAFAEKRRGEQGASEVMDDDPTSLEHTGVSSSPSVPGGNTDSKEETRPKPSL